MKICRYIAKNSYIPEPRLGILSADQTYIIDAQNTWASDYKREGYFNFLERAKSKCPNSLSTILKTNDDPLEFFEQTYGLHLFLEKVGDLAPAKNLSSTIQVQEVNLLCPLDKIGTYRDFYIHEKHVKKGFEKRGEKVPEAWYEMPVYYKGSTASFIGPNETIPWPSYSNLLDFELELGLVIGRDGKNIKEAEANKHIFGFTIFNDISARDIQKKEMSVRLGPSKGKDFCSIMGPYIVTYDEFNFTEPNLKMQARVNGEKWSEGYSGDGHFSWAQMLCHASKEEWLLASDFVGSGTVGTGCGLELDRWIQEDDVLELEIEKLGILKNTVGRKESKNG